MIDHKIGCLPVLEPDGRLAGILTEEDFLRWVAEETPDGLHSTSSGVS
jgi:CBS domain-containing protein